MDPEAISRQARAAIDSLTLQLQSLEAQQSALLTSTLLTTHSLDPPTSTSTTPTSPETSIPNYHLISPTLHLIPSYTAKLARLRTLMSSQTLEITQLRRRVEEVKRARKRNLERVRGRWERERERDRTVLRARMVVVQAQEGGAEAAGGRPREIQGGATAATAATAAPVGMVAPTPTPPMSPSSLQEGVKVVKRKKKVRQAEM